MRVEDEGEGTKQNIFLGGKSERHLTNSGAQKRGDLWWQGKGNEIVGSLRET